MGYLISGIGIGLAIWSPQFLTTFFIYLSGSLALCGFGLLLVGFGREKIIIPLDPYKQLLIQRLRILPRLNPILLKNERQLYPIGMLFTQYLDKLKKSIIHINNHLMGKNGSQAILFLGQIAFVGLSIAFFCFIEKQTQMNTHLQALPQGQFLQILQKDMINLGLLGFLPWVLYAVLGVGFAYLTVVKGRAPYLPTAILSKEKKLPGLFFHNFMCIILEANILFSIIFTVGFTMLFLTETSAFLLDFKSIFHIPYLTMFIIGMLVLTLRRTSKSCVDWMIANQISLGSMLILLVLGFSLFMLWFFNLGDHFLTLLNEQHLLEAFQTKDPKLMPWGNTNTSRYLSIDVQHRRLSLLIWGWWMVWLPWMTSFVARWSIGLSVWEALVRALIVPLALFSWIFWQMDLQDFLSLSRWLEAPEVRIAMSLGLGLFIWSLWGKIRSTWMLSIGAMLPLKPGKQRSLKNWMINFLFWLAIYTSSWFAIGWVPAQVLSSYGAGFLTLLVAFFLWAMFKEWKINLQAKSQEEIFVLKANEH